MVFLGLFLTSLDFDVTATSYSWQIPLGPGLPGGRNLVSLWVLYTYSKFTVASLAFPCLKEGSGKSAFALATMESECMIVAPGASLSKLLLLLPGCSDQRLLSEQRQLTSVGANEWSSPFLLKWPALPTSPVFVGWLLLMASLRRITVSPELLLSKGEGHFTPVIFV